MTIRSIEAEQAVIGSILIDARCLDSVAQLLRPQDFGMEINRAMYRVILSMDREGRKIDPVTVRRWPFRPERRYQAKTAGAV